MAATRTHEVILRRIEEQLASGELLLGDRLPAERALAEQFGVSRPSVREGLKVLEALGVVAVTGGQGRESGAVVVARPGVAIGAAMRLHVGTQALPIADLVETRVLLETAALRRLADRVRATGDPDVLLGVPGAVLEEMAAPGLDPAAFHRLDSAFHVALAEAAGNVVVGVIMASLREAIEAYVLSVVPLLADWPAVARGLRAEHAEVLAALRRADGETAAVIVERHIRRFFAEADASSGTSDPGSAVSPGRPGRR